MPPRLPLIRFGVDDTPVVWWEWLFYPLVIVLITFCFVAFMRAAIPITAIHFVRAVIRFRHMKRELAAAGRFLTAEQLVDRLRAGLGTLIVVYEWPKGPIEEWWTTEDIIAIAPIPLPSSIHEGQSSGLSSFAENCIATYTDRNTGNAMLTCGVPDESGLVVANAFPNAKFVTISRCAGGKTFSMATGHIVDRLRNDASASHLN